MKKGWYRIKLIPQNVGESKYTFYVNGLPNLECTIIAKDFCTDYRLVKYLDKNGKYRFFPFASNWQRVNRTTQIGEISNFVTSIYSSQGSMRNIGYNNIQTLSLTAEKVSDNEIEVLEDMYVSPCVLLYVGNGITDNTSDWVIVNITGDGIGKSKQKGLKKINVEIRLPESNTMRL